MLQFGKSFDYNGSNSKDFDLQMVRFDNLEVPTGLSREIVKGSTNFYRRRANHYGTTYSDVLVFEIHFIKNICDNDNASFIKNDIRKINAWLTSSSIPKKLHVYNFDYENEEEYDYYGIFTDVQYELNSDKNGRTISFITTFTCDSPYGWVEKIKEFHADIDTAINIEIESDELEDYIYPLIKIETDNIEGATTRTLSIENLSDVSDRKLEITVSDDMTFWIDADKMTIYDELGLIDLDSLGIGDEGNFYLPRFINGSNNLIVAGQATLTFSWSEPRKTGAI